MQQVQPARVEKLMLNLGKIPFEIALTSFLFQLVGTYVDFKADALVDAIIKRLYSAHQNLQVRSVQVCMYSSFQSYDIASNQLPCDFRVVVGHPYCRLLRCLIIAPAAHRMQR
jgi:hypothetical protein